VVYSTHCFLRIAGPPAVMAKSACQLLHYSCEHKIHLIVAEVVCLIWPSGKLLLALASTVFFVPTPAGLIIILYCLTTVGVMTFQVFRGRRLLKWRATLPPPNLFKYYSKIRFIFFSSCTGHARELLPSDFLNLSSMGKRVRYLKFVT
jgi:hypothetical protein